MSGIGILVALGTPLVLGVLLWVRASRALALVCAPYAAVPAFMLAAGWLGPAHFDAKPLLLGMQLGMHDAVDRGFMLLTSGVWLASGLFARAYMTNDPHRRRFWTFFLLTQAANIAVVLAMDVATFYCAYAAMTFLAYGLVVHEQSGRARRAARVYFVMSLLGELAVLGAMFLIVDVRINLPLREVPAAVAESPARDLIVALVLAGFGVKVGTLGLHVWLPLAHPVAPTPASAVLSGALIKAGLLGWLRFLPIGEVALPRPGLACVVAGLAAAFYAVANGLAQRDAKTVLAYSSVSQMGFVTATAGVALAVPESARLATAALVFYAVHHAVVKSALFLGAGLAGRVVTPWSRRLVLAGLALVALDLAGAPLSSGALAKLSIKDLLGAGPWSTPQLSTLLSVGAVGSTVLMTHFLALVAKHVPTRAEPVTFGLWVPWVALVVVALTLIVALPVDEALEILADPSHVWSALWPIGAGIALFAILRPLRADRVGAEVAPGDLLVVYTRVFRAIRRFGGVLARTAAVEGRRLRDALPPLASVPPIRGALRQASRLETAFEDFAVLGGLFAALLAAGLLLAWR